MNMKILNLFCVMLYVMLGYDVMGLPVPQSQASQAQCGDEKRVRATVNQEEEQATNSQRDKRAIEIEETMQHNEGEKEIRKGEYETIDDRSENEIQDDYGFPVAAPENGSDQSGPQNYPHSKPEMMAALQMNAKLSVADEPSLKKDILKERHFLPSPLFQGMEVLNNQISFTVVSYNIMAEPETEVGGPAIIIGRRCANGLSIKAGTSKHTQRLLDELSFLQLDIICLQSVTMAHNYWNKLEKQLGL